MANFIPVKKMSLDRLKRILDGALAMRVRKLAAYPKNQKADLPEDCDPEKYILSRESDDWKDAYHEARKESGKRNPIIAVG